MMAISCFSGLTFKPESTIYLSFVGITVTIWYRLTMMLFFIDAELFADLYFVPDKDVNTKFTLPRKVQFLSNSFSKIERD